MTRQEALAKFRDAIARRVERDPFMSVVRVDASLCDDGHNDVMVYVEAPGDCTAAVLCYTLAHNEIFDRSRVERAFIKAAGMVAIEARS